LIESSQPNILRQRVSSHWTFGKCTFYDCKLQLLKVIDYPKWSEKNFIVSLGFKILVTSFLSLILVGQRIARVHRKLQKWIWNRIIFFNEPLLINKLCFSILSCWLTRNGGFRLCRANKRSSQPAPTSTDSKFSKPQTRYFIFCRNFLFFYNDYVIMFVNLFLKWQV